MNRTQRKLIFQKARRIAANLPRSVVVEGDKKVTPEMIAAADAKYQKAYDAEMKASDALNALRTRARNRRIHLDTFDACEPILEELEFHLEFADGTAAEALSLLATFESKAKAAVAAATKAATKGLKIISSESE